ncbi:MAG: oxidoreductase [Gallionella sp.]|nr:oxidoreductase [Gallionella sp.]
MSAQLRVALLGYGYAGKTIHAPLIASTPDLDLVAICSSDAAKVIADLPEVKVCATLQELLHSTEVDVVVIATPNDTHFELARQALLAGKHVVVDKPFTLTATQAYELKALAEHKQRVLSVFHNRRWDADFLTLRAVIASGQLGKLQSLVSRFDRYRPEVRARWREQQGAGGGLWYDLGPHLLDQAVQLFGRPIALQAKFEMQREEAQAIDYFQVTLRYQDMQVTLHASMLVKEETPRFVLTGTAGSYTKYGLDTQEESLKRGEVPGANDWGRDPRDGELNLNLPHQNTIFPNQRGDYRCFYKAFRDAVLSNGENPVAVDDAVFTMELIELAIVSSKTRSEMLVA